MGKRSDTNLIHVEIMYRKDKKVKNRIWEIDTVPIRADSEFEARRRIVLSFIYSGFVVRKTRIITKDN